MTKPNGFKTVSFEIPVPDSGYCWDHKFACEHFDNYGGHPTCKLGFFGQRQTAEGYVLKPETCSALKVVTND